MEGTVASASIVNGYRRIGSAAFNKSSFLMKLNNEIVGIPSEVVVRYLSPVGFYLQVGDKIKIQGTIYQELLKFWNKDFIWIDAKHIFNETLGCGF